MARKGTDESFIGKSWSRLQAITAKITHRHRGGQALPDASKLSSHQQRALTIAVVIALVVGVYLVGHFFTVIVVSLLAAVISYPLYERINRRLGRPGRAAMLTLVASLLIVIIPLTIVIIITVSEAKHLLDELSHLSGSLSVNDATDQLLKRINKFLSSVTNGAYQVSAEQLHSSITHAVSELASFFLNVLTSSFSSIANFITQFILYIYIFTSLLTHAGSLQRTFRAFNPLGDAVSSLYLTRTAQMARGALGGQLVIAACQGFVEAGILYVAGIHYYFFFAMLLTLLSIIPLGGGIVAIPIGIIMLLTGNIWQGLVVLLGHFLVITNIDNVLRPRLIPRSARMNSALMMLAVFGGLGLFGFLGIFIGPIIMILVVSTLQLYQSQVEIQTKQTRKPQKA